MTMERSDVEKRVSRLEAMFAAWIASEGGEFDPEATHHLLRSLGRRLDFERDDFSMFLHDVLWHRRDIKPRYERIEHALGEMRQETAGKTEEISVRVNRLEETVAANEKNQSETQIELHSLLSAYSLGLDVRSIPLPRFIPIRVYLSRGDSKETDRVTAAMEKVCEAYGIAIADDFPAEHGSWWKKWFGKTTTALTQPEVVERLQKLERAVEMKVLHEPQSQIDKNEAEAAAALITAMSGVVSGAMQLGSLLLVKLPDAQGNPCIQAKTLSQAEMIYLEKNQTLFQSPHELLGKLQQHSATPKRPQVQGTSKT